MSMISPVIGHETAQAQLVRYLQRDNLPHALLLTGPKGIGKAALANAIIRCLLSGAHREAAAEGLFGDALPEAAPERLTYHAHHPAIIRLEAGGHGNVKQVKPLADEKKKMSFTTINIEQIREVVGFMHLSTAEAGWRIVLIDPADGLNTNAENALLKILEEPPAQTLLILVTHQPDRLLPTTRSRCREITLTPPSEVQILQILQGQGVKVTAEDQHWLAALAPLSAGAWQGYLENDAQSLYHDWLQLVAAPAVDKVQPFATRLAKLEAAQWQVATELYWRVLQRLHYYAMGGFTTPEWFISAAEEGAMQGLAATPLVHWQESYAQALHWLPRTTQDNYDKKQVIQSLLYQAGNRPKAAA